MNSFKALDWLAKLYCSISMTAVVCSIALLFLFNDKSRNTDSVVQLEEDLVAYKSMEEYLKEFLDGRIDNNILGLFEDPFTSYRVLANFERHYSQLQRFVVETDLDEQPNLDVLDETIAYMRRFNEVDYMEMRSLVSFAHSGAHKYKTTLDQLLAGHRSYKDMHLERLAIVLQFLHNETHGVIDSVYWSDGDHAIKSIFHDHRREGFRTIAKSEWDSVDRRLTQGNTARFVSQVANLDSSERSMSREELNEQIVVVENSLKEGVAKLIGNDKIDVTSSLPKMTSYDASYFLLLVQVMLVLSLCVLYVLLPKLVHRKPTENDFNMIRFICFPIEPSPLVFRLILESIWFFVVVLALLVFSSDYNPHHVETSALKAASSYGEVRVEKSSYDLLAGSLVALYLATVLLRLNLPKRVGNYRHSNPVTD